MDRTRKNRHSGRKSKTPCELQGDGAIWFDVPEVNRGSQVGRGWGLALLAIGVWMDGVGAAHASAGFSCSIEDKALRVSVEGAFSRGVGEGVINFGGRLEVLAKATPEDLRRLDLERENLTQTWINGRDLKLRMYRERAGAAPHGYVELVLETRQSSRDELEYAGAYVLTVHHLVSEQDSQGKTFTARGKARCSAG
jgi:hypothetical protein